MPTIANAAYYVTTAKLEIETDDYTAGVTSAALVPTTPTSQVADIGGGVQGFVGAAAWALQITFSQDWITPGSLSLKCIEWHGQKKTVKITPEDGGAILELPVTFMAAQAGAAAGAHATATATFPGDGQPTITPAA